MKIIDINGKEREIKFICKINHNVTDSITGETIPELFVEVMIVGNNREWMEWWPYKEFRKYNPHRKPRYKR